MKLAALVPALGDGRRRHAGVRKPYQLLNGRPLLSHVLERLERCKLVDDVYPLVAPEELPFVQEQIVSSGKFGKVREIMEAGLLRQDFVHRALVRLQPGYELVMIHDGCRPLVSQALLERTIKAAEVHGAAIAAEPVHDTIKTISRDNFVTSSYDRRRLRAVQTPMVFRYDILLRAYAQAARENYYASDEAVLVERLGERIKVVAGSRFNLYVATRDDFHLASALLKLEESGLRPGEDAIGVDEPDLRPPRGDDEKGLK